MDEWVRLVYFSRSAAQFDVHGVLRIVDTARTNNARSDITGALLFSHDHFLQVLEGDPVVVNALYRKIVLDERHTDPVLLDYRPIANRCFGKWSMAFCSQEQATREVLRQFCGADTLRPALLSGDDAVALLQAVTSHADDRAHDAGS